MSIYWYRTDRVENAITQKKKITLCKPNKKAWKIYYNNWEEPAIMMSWTQHSIHNMNG